MNFVNEASKLLTNKYFLYFMVFLAGSNILGYLVTNKLNAIIFFALVSFLTYQFSKNMAVILLVSLLATNFLMANRFMLEGLENQNDDKKEETQAMNKIEDKDKEIAEAIPKVKSSSANDEVKKKIEETINKSLEEDESNVVDINNKDLNKNKEKGPEGFGEKMSNNKKTKTDEHFGPRLDYAATIEQSYQNLDEILGSDSIKKLTNDTQKLMQQQQNLFNTMNQMVPVLEGAQNLLKGFDMEGLTKSLQGIGGLSNLKLKN